MGQLNHSKCTTLKLNDKMNKQEAEKGLPDYLYIIGKQFKHYVSGRIVEIDSLDVTQHPQSGEMFEIMVAATPTGEKITTTLVEEVDYFLGSYRQIS
jgi:hypothetical protein